MVDPTANQASPTPMDTLREYLSATKPTKIAPRNAPSSSMAVIILERKRSARNWRLFRNLSGSPLVEPG
jgi:hypothetical protein